MGIHENEGKLKIMDQKKKKVVKQE